MLLPERINTLSKTELQKIIKLDLSSSKIRIILYLYKPTSVSSVAFTVASDKKGTKYHQVILVSVHRYSTNAISTL
jgi:hypothetical protein